MKTKIKKATYEQVMQMPRAKHKNPPRPSRLFATVINVMSRIELKKLKFTCENSAKEVLKKGPCFILMNHSSFIDLKIASRILYPMPYNIVCTADGFVGKEWLMRAIGCTPTQKFVTDLSLLKDIKYALKKGNHVLMYPEAGYSFDGRATVLPKKLGALLKMLNVPVVSVITQGAFSYDPLYNCLQTRKVKVSAKVEVLATQEELKTLDTAVLDKRISDAFSFDNFAWQYENKIEINEPFRADGLERILYKCPNCKTEGKMVGKGTEIVCNHCGKRHILNVYGRLEAIDGETVFAHIPDWYNWQREEVKKELLSGEYKLDTQVDIAMLVNYKAIYMIGGGRLVHDSTGFTLTGENESFEYKQSPTASYTLNADYYWYEIGDIISIGNKDCLYYCFPKQEGVVTKTRLATEELFKILKNK